MYNLSRISIFLYYLICCICLSFYLFFALSGAESIPSSTYLLYGILLIPLISYFFEELQLRDILRYNFSKREKIAFSCLGILFLGAILMEYVTPGYTIGVAGVGISYLLRSAKIFFMGVLLFLGATILFLIFGENLRAEESSVFVYYLLIAGVIIEILLHFLSPNSNIFTDTQETNEK